MDTKFNMETVINHLKTTWRYWLAIVYFTILIIVIATVYNKHKVKPVPEPVVAVQPAPVVVDLDPINRRLTALEQDLASQAAAYKTLKYEHDALYATNQRLERRAQAHLEAIKRMCEYIVVITVDKKIVPRQCLPEYRWSTTEGN